MKPNIETFIGKSILLIKLKSVVDEYEEQKLTKNSLKMIGGRLRFEIEDGLIINENKIKNSPVSGLGYIYLTKKYIEEYKDNLFWDIKKVINNYLVNINNVSALDVIKL